ncbi:MAG: hypothetical protein QOI69_1299, partial [Pseudonocardiales bacterium]|nr:hypothetical protein [Pseudonocardiales bacterium]
MGQFGANGRNWGLPMNTVRHHWRRKAATASTAAVLTFSLATVAEAAPAGHAVAPGGLSAKAADQIAALQQIKQSLSPAERKLDSRLA